MTLHTQSVFKITFVSPRSGLGLENEILKSDPNVLISLGTWPTDRVATEHIRTTVLLLPNRFERKRSSKREFVDRCSLCEKKHTVINTVSIIWLTLKGFEEIVCEFVHYSAFPPSLFPLSQKFFFPLGCKLVWLHFIPVSVRFIGQGV